MGQRSPNLARYTATIWPRESWRGALLLITVAGCVLRVAALDAKTLWLDEAFSLWMARHSLPDLLTWLVQIDHHPPLYYLLLHQWRGWFGDSPAALRSLSAMASTLAIPAFALAARKLAGNGVGLVAALLLALSPFHLRYAQETRMYGVLVLTVALLLWALATLLSAHRGERLGRWWVLLTCTEAAAMLTHNTATVLVPLALNVAVAGVWWGQRCGWWRGEWTGLTAPHFARNWLLSQAAALLLWSPWSVAFVRQAQVVDNDFWIESPELWDVWLALNNLTFAHLPSWVPQRDYLAWLALLLVAIGCWQGRRHPGVTWLLLTLWLVPPSVELLVSLRRPIFYDRTLIWTTLPYFVLIAHGIVWPAPPRIQWAWRGSMVLLMAVLNVAGIVGYYRDFAKEDWDQAAAVVAARAKPQELILFHASWAELPFNYYYPDHAPALNRHGVPADLFDAGALEPPMTAADVGRIEELIAGHKRAWLVYSHWWYTDPAGLLLETLAAEMTVAEEHAWPGIRVIEYRRR